MTSLHAAEIEWIVALQHTADLERIFRYASYVGYSSIPYLIGVIYMAVSRGLGMRLSLLFALNSGLVATLKIAFHLPRPFHLDPRIHILDAWGSYGMPSGHVQATTCAWLLLARGLRSVWAWFAALLVIAAVALSRVYFGVHFISDTAGGFLAGGGIVALFLWGEARFRARWRDPWSQHFGLVILATAILVTLGFAAAWTVPELEADPASTGLSKVLHALKQALGFAGGFAVTGCALIAANRWARFEVAGPLWERGLRCLFAFAGAELIEQAFSLLPIPKWRLAHALFSAAKLASIPLWVLLIAPLILMGAGLLRASKQGPEIHEHGATG